MESRQTNAYVSLFVTGVAALCSLALRLLARHLTKVQIWTDDYLTIAAFMAAMAWSAVILWSMPNGFGLHLENIDLPEDEVLYKARLMTWLGELFYAFSLAFSKLAILAFYWRMFKTSNLKLPIIVLAGCATIWLTLRTFLCIFHCFPIQGYWDKTIDATCPVDDSKFMFGTTLVHLIIDVAILALPVIQVQKLKLPLTQKLAVSTMFMFGIFVCIASVPTLYYALLFDAKSNEVFWNIAPVFIWATVEVNLAVVSACLPMLRPIWTVYIKRIPLSNPSPHSGGYTRDGYARTISDAHGTQLKSFNGTVQKREDNESIYPIAAISTDGDRDGSVHSDGESHGYDGMHHAFDGTKGVSTVISTQNQSPQHGTESPLSAMKGIIVQNETTVKYSRPQ